MPKLLSIIAGPVTGAIVYYFAMSNDIAIQICSMCFITAWMAVWWITEAVAIGVTSLLPFVLMPVMHIMKAEQVALQYMEQTIFLFIGGFFLAYAMEKWDLHLRIAYRIILLSGSSPLRILAGIMVTAYFISMWISNTATVLMLVAAVTAIVKHKELFEEEIQKNIAPALLIALAYSATIGGMATIVGTPTNMIFTAFWETHYPLREQVTFLSWCRFGIPFSILLLTIGFLILKNMFNISNKATGKQFIRNKYRALGPVTQEQKVVTLFFGLAILLWFSRTGFNFGEFRIEGWDNWFKKGYIKDSTVAILAAICLFVIPSRAKGKFILEWEDVKRLPYHIILLFGGGFALAKGIEVSGMGDYMAGQLQFFKNYPLWILVAVLVVIVTLLSEIASNVATITLMLPILASLAAAINIDPIKLMLPATFAASFGFMLVIATAPNTIAYATGQFESRQLLRTGLLMNLAGIILLTLAMTFINFF